MNVALIGLGTKDLDRVLAWIMFAAVGVAVAGVIFLWARHARHARRGRKTKTP